jgi:predicted nucleic acid-binding protein
VEQEHVLPFWDALILQAAKVAGCTCVYSEDLHPGLDIQGMRVVDPF